MIARYPAYWGEQALATSVATIRLAASWGGMGRTRRSPTRIGVTDYDWCLKLAWGAAKANRYILGILLKTPFRSPEHDKSVDGGYTWDVTTDQNDMDWQLGHKMVQRLVGYQIRTLAWSLIATLVSNVCRRITVDFHHQPKKGLTRLVILKPSKCSIVPQIWPPRPPFSTSQVKRTLWEYMNANIRFNSI